MKRRLFNILAAVSGAMAFGLLMMWATGSGPEREGICLRRGAIHWHLYYSGYSAWFVYGGYRIAERSVAVAVPVPLLALPLVVLPAWWFVLEYRRGRWSQTPARGPWRRRLFPILFAHWTASYATYVLWWIVDEVSPWTMGYVPNLPGQRLVDSPLWIALVLPTMSLRALMDDTFARGAAPDLVCFWLSYLLILGAILAFFIVPARRRHRVAHWRALGLCLTCGYDLRASSERCPECGTPIPADLARRPMT